MDSSSLDGLIESFVVELESLCNQMNVESSSRQHSKQVRMSPHVMDQLCVMQDVSFRNHLVHRKW